MICLMLSCCTLLSRCMRIAAAHDKLAVGALQGKGELQNFQDCCARADIVVAEGLQDEVAAERVLHAAAAVPTLVAFGCAQSLQAVMRFGSISATDSGYSNFPWKASVCNGTSRKHVALASL
jgi:hypothetical protein